MTQIPSPKKEGFCFIEVCFLFLLNIYLRSPFNQSGTFFQFPSSEGFCFLINYCYFCKKKY